MDHSSSQEGGEDSLKTGGILQTEVTGLADGGTSGRKIRKQGCCVGFQPEQLRGPVEEFQADDQEQWGQGGAEGRSQELLTDTVVSGAHWTTSGKR